MRFIDLFAGLGGFHVGLSRLGHKCVFASEIQEELRQLYEMNFDMMCHGNISEVPSNNIPDHDILCAGFPCQPFSKAGDQSGLSDPRGNLFYEIIRILEDKEPDFFILENVANLKRHNKGETWSVIIKHLAELGYTVNHQILSPHQFGIPQLRERIFILGSRSNLVDQEFRIEGLQMNNELHINSILDNEIPSSEGLGPKERNCISLWQNIISSLPNDQKLPSFPIWATEFGASYPFLGKAPHKFTAKELAKFTGAFGQPLAGKSKAEQINLLPPYAQVKTVEFPYWKKKFIHQNREFYHLNKNFLDPYIKSLRSLPHSWQKFEWNCNGEPRNLSSYILQFRASGLRVKRPNYSPSLVASTLTQIPIIGWQWRYMSKREAARLQSLENITLPESKTMAFKALGNAVNASLVEGIARNFLKEDSIVCVDELSLKLEELVYCLKTQTDALF